VIRRLRVRHDHVHMRMVRHRRAPGVGHRGDADAGAEVLEIGRKISGQYPLRRARSSIAGPFNTVPSAANWDPWQGQSQHCSS
jgi:hypothetical protein